MDDSELDTLERMVHIAARYETAARALLDIAWIADGVSDTEREFIVGLSPIAYYLSAAAERVLALTWVADGISDTEAPVAVWLYLIAKTDADAALQVMGMPFLQTLDAADAAALNSLRKMNSDQLADMLSRPMLEDGITDDEARIVSMLSGDPDVDDKLLDPDAITVERRTVDLSLAGGVDLVIVRTRPGARRTMDLLENAVRETENLMGKPFPKDYVGLLVENAVGHSSSDGWNFGTHIAIRPEHGADAPLIAHEVAHYYWLGNAVWINEGMAELMELAIENRRVGTPINVRNAPCSSVRSIKELEALAPEKGDPAFNCNYSLGEGLFVSLLRTLGEDSFWEGAHKLYAASRRPGRAGIEEVRQAFGPDEEDVIARWYDGE